MPKLKLDWQASESAPKSFPMRIVSGNLFYHDGSGALYVPDKATIDHGWGSGRSNHVVGPDLKPLPNRLGITFFSYTENQFYEGKFDLPYDTILKLFQEGYYSYTEKDHVTYGQFVVGVAPGGAVAVWLVGLNRTIEVFFGQADKADLDWGTLTSATHITREVYVQKRVQESLKTPEAIEALRKNGVPFGLWERYRTRYVWQPKFTGMVLRDGRTKMLTYFNGEGDFLQYPLEPLELARSRAVPNQMNFVWMRPGAPKGRNIELYFNEAEIYAAFTKLGANNTPLHLELHANPLVPTGFTIWLKTDKDPDKAENGIELKRTEVKNYGL